MINVQDLADYLDLEVNFLASDISKKFSEEKKEITAKTRLTHKASRHYMMKSGLKFASRVLTIAALKGGIGKTFLSTNVAVRASMLGAKVLLIDLDPEACATNSLLSEDQIESPHKLTIYDILQQNLQLKEGIVPTKYEGLEIVPSSLRVSKAEKMVSGQNPKTLLKKLIEGLSYDFIFFELPPSFSTLSGSAYLAADMVLIPCTPNIYALESVDLTIEAIKEIAVEFERPNISYRVILNMFNPTRNASQDTLNVLKDDHPDFLFPHSIRESADIQNAINAGLSVFEAKCHPSIRENIDKLTKFLCPLEIFNSDKKSYEKGQKSKGSEANSRAGSVTSFN